jgi:hypothetical protein
MGQAEAQLALYRLASILEAEGLPYAIIGAFALNEYGHKRVTVDVDLVMRDEHLSEFKRRHLGNGYAERVPGTGKLLDTLRTNHQHQAMRATRLAPRVQPGCAPSPRVRPFRASARP